MKKLAIIGGGLCGNMVVNMLSHLLPFKAEIKITLISDVSPCGFGTTYGPDVDGARLNRTPSGMSIAFNMEETDFADWIRLGCEYQDSKYGSYLPRHVFGSYMLERLSQSTQRLMDKSINFNCEITRVVDIKLGGAVDLEKSDGRREKYDMAVFAIGPNYNADPYGLLGEEGYFDCPYPLKTLSSEISPKNNQVAVLGSSLSAVEAALSVNKVCPYATISMISRTGRLPLVRPEQEVATPSYLSALNTSQKDSISLAKFNELLDMELKVFGTSYESIMNNKNVEPREEFFNSIESSKGNRNLWHNMTGSLNNIFNNAYSCLSFEDRQEFRARYGAQWLRKRIPIPIDVAEKLQRLILDGKIVLVKGVNRIDKRQDGLFYAESPRGGGVYGAVINATGYCNDITKSDSSILSKLVEVGGMETDEFGRGIVDYDTCLTVCENGSGDDIYVMGQATEGTYYFTSAVNVLAEQSLRICKDILDKTYKEPK